MLDIRVGGYAHTPFRLQMEFKRSASFLALPAAHRSETSPADSIKVLLRIGSWARSFDRSYSMCIPGQSIAAQVLHIAHSSVISVLRFQVPLVLPRPYSMVIWFGMSFPYSPAALRSANGILSLSTPYSGNMWQSSAGLRSYLASRVVFAVSPRSL